MDWLDWLIHILRMHVVPPWLLHGPIEAFFMSLLIFPSSFGAVTLDRVVRERKLYFGDYVSFWGGEGLCLSALMGLVSIVLHGDTPHAIYTELWFYFLLYVLLRRPVLKGAKAAADKAEANNRPKEIGKLPSERTHTRWLPIIFVFIVWAGFVAVDAIFFRDHTPWFILVAAIPVGVLWGVTMYLDDKRPTPQTLAEWTRFIGPIMVLALAFFTLAFA